MAHAKYNWDEIEHEYVTGKLTYRELAEKHNASISRLGVVGHKRNWGTKRKEYRKGISTAAIEEAKKTAALAKTRFDDLAVRACDAVVAAMAMEATEHYNNGQLNEKRSKTILAAVRDALDIKYRILDIPMPMQRHDVDSQIRAPADVTREQVEKILDEIELTSFAAVTPGGNGSDKNLN